LPELDRCNALLQARRTALQRVKTAMTTRHDAPVIRQEIMNCVASLYDYEDTLATSAADTAIFGHSAHHYLTSPTQFGQLSVAGLPLPPFSTQLG